MADLNITYNQAVKQIEEILNRIENEDLDVDELTNMVKTASGLIKFCKSKLFESEKEIEKILNDIDVKEDEENS